MYLIHIDTLQIHEFTADRIPVYAILSHRWTEDEISFKDFRKSRNLGSIGYQKVKSFASFLRSHSAHGHIDYIWVDTCCIDKKSSAELSEAINSMFMWYRNAEACCVYLGDVEYVPGSSVPALLEQSQWFTRGWTLQELIAPEHVYFVNKDWTMFLGEKRTLRAILSRITGISDEVFESDIARIEHIRMLPAAQKMSWAARRNCSRGEDEAYCLMGLFDVNMPLLYGEGSRKAFLRLQQEIMKNSLDHSIFAHRGNNLLATSARDFSQSGGLSLDFGQSFGHSDFNEYAFTNRGIRFEAVLRRGPASTSRNPKFQHAYFSLNCGKAGRQTVIELSEIRGDWVKEACHFEGPPIVLPHSDAAGSGHQLETFYVIPF